MNTSLARTGTNYRAWLEMPDLLPDPGQATTFHFLGHQFDPATGIARLNYRFDNGPVLTETYTFPHQPWPQEPGRQRALTRAFDLLHLIAGISYYKAGVQTQLHIDYCNPGAEMESVLRNLYSRGLAEFAWTNQVQLPAAPEFVCTHEPAVYEAPELRLQGRVLLALGGGKDSLVSVELLRRTGLEIMLACSGNSPLIATTARVAGLPLLAIGRSLAPELARYNKQGALNGHVPVTAINSALLVCAALLYGFDSVVFSNESSASAANLFDEGGNEINHQYSKSIEFEALFRSLVHGYISPEINYYSLMRPYSELAILGMFSGFPKYHGVFSSCNRNFHQDGPHIEGNWCGSCPKCLFTYLGLSVFMARDELEQIFGVDLLSDPDLTDKFAALCGLGQHKPFECVGEIEESRAAVIHLNEKGTDSPVINTLATALANISTEPVESCLQVGAEHFIPPEIWEEISAAG